MSNRAANIFFPLRLKGKLRAKRVVLDFKVRFTVILLKNLGS